MPERTLQHQVVVDAPIEAVWEAFATEAGARTFFAPQARIEAAPGGAYELYFDLAASPGQRGGEGCTVVSLDPPHTLCFTWNFPPHLPIRDRFTEVQVTLTGEGRARTRVRLTQTGWEAGPAWDAGFAYFERAWPLVLARLQHRFEAGPLDWSDPWRP